MARWKYYIPEIPAQVEVPNKDLVDIFYDSVSESPDSPFLIFQGNEMTYKEVGENVRRLANSLADLGITKGDRVAILFPNCPQFITSYLSVLYLGGIVTAVSPLYTTKEVKHLLVDSGAKAIITLDLFLERIREIRDETDLKNVIVSSVADGLSKLKGFLYKTIIGRKNPKARGDELKYSDLIKNGADKDIKAQIDPKNDIACLQYTGGTTGVPKGAMLTHYNLVSQVVVIHYWEYYIGGPLPGVQRTNLAALPLSHIFGLTASFLWPMYGAGSITLMPDPRKLEELMATIEKYKIQYFMAVPTLFQKIGEHPKITEYDFSSLRMSISGGSSLHPEVARVFEEKTGGLLVEGYGLTEASPVTHINPVNANLKRKGIGIPVPNTDAKCVCLKTGKELTKFSKEDGLTEEGELLVHGPQVMKGYWNKPEATADVLSSDGWLRTGDVVKMDEDGYFIIVDRLKDVIFASGYQVWPLEVEDVLCNHPGISMAAVIPVKESEQSDNEVVKAVLVSREGAERLSLEEIKKYCKKHLAPYKVPRIIEYREELPLSPIGKVLRRPLREEAALLKAKTDQS